MSYITDKEFAEAAQPLQDKVYKHIYKDSLKEINRYAKEDSEEKHILDREYHIDTELIFKNGIKILGQEKALRKKFSSFDTFTVEFYQNRYTKERGEFFNLGAQFYLHGYMNADTPEEITCFLKCYFIKIFDFLEWLKKKLIKELELKTRPTAGSNASFYWVGYDDIPDKFIYWKYRKPTI